MGRLNKTAEERLLERRIIDSNGCWNYTMQKTKSGHGRIRLHNEMILVHRLAASLWLNFDLSSDSLVLHKCDNPPCFNPEHLYVGTALDNMNDRKIRGAGYSRTEGSFKSGANHKMSKLTETEVLAIRELSEQGKTHKELSGLFDVHEGTISKIVLRTRWNHI